MQAWRDGGLAGWEIVRVHTRSRPAPNFFDAQYDLIIEAAGPAALAMHGVRALECADVWTVSGSALADSRLFDALEEAGERSGHRLRLVAGAIAGLDAVAAGAVDPQAELRLELDLPPGEASSGVPFSGSVREAAARFPGNVNVAVAAALAGPGLDHTRVEVTRPAGPRHRLALTIQSRFGTTATSSEPRVAPGTHPVAACLIAELQRELRTIWAG